MRATADIEKQSVSRIERHQRREAVAPVRDMSESLRVRRHIGVEYFDIGADRPRIRKWCSEFKPDGRCCIIHGDDLQRGMLLVSDDPGFTKTRFIQRGASA